MAKNINKSKPYDKIPQNFIISDIIWQIVFIKIEKNYKLIKEMKNISKIPTQILPI